MGPADRALNLTERLRPWVGLGLTDVLAPGSGIRFQGCSAASPRQEQRQNRPGTPQQPPARPTRPAEHGRQSVQPRSKIHAPIELPEPWLDFIKGYPNGARMVWTYFELGLNKWLKPDVERSKLFKGLIDHLRLPQGSIAFCPMTELAGEVMVPRTDLFWEVVRRLGAQVIACFGEPGFRTLCPRATRGRFHITDSGLTVHILPDPILLLTMPLERRLACVDHLREVILSPR